MDTIKNRDDCFNSNKCGISYGEKHQNHNVREYGDESVITKLITGSDVETISLRTLNDVDKAVANYKSDKVSMIIDLSDFD